jgi:flavin prenyltransferase
MKRIIVGLSGASGSLIYKRLIETLIKEQVEVYVIASVNAEKVFEYETGQNCRQFLFDINSEHLHLCEVNDMFSKVASGSFKTDGMIIAPCSMGTAGKIAHGTSDNLMVRAFDVCLKEHRKTLVVPREAPLSAIHLENLLTLARLGVCILPPVPAFYNKPTTVAEIIDQIVGRILDYFDIPNNLKQTWNGGF